MSKKSVIPMIIITLCYTSILLLGYKNMSSKIESKGGLKTNGLSYICQDNNGESEFDYSANLTNTNGKTIFIKSIEPSLDEALHSKVLSKKTVVAVNKNLKPNETIVVSGSIMLDAKGISAFEIGKLIKDIKVSTEEPVSIK